METELNKRLGQRIRELRISKNLKQGQIADLMDMERSNFTRIESGKQAPSDKNLEKIAKILEVEIKDLFDFEHIKTRNELIKSISNEIQTLSDKEIIFLYKSIINMKQMR